MLKWTKWFQIPIEHHIAYPGNVIILSPEVVAWVHDCNNGCEFYHNKRIHVATDDPSFKRVIRFSDNDAMALFKLTWGLDE